MQKMSILRNEYGIGHLKKNIDKFMEYSNKDKIKTIGMTSIPIVISEVKKFL